MQPVWPRYFEACHAVIFVADTSSAASAAAAAIEWYNLLAAPVLQKKPLMLVFNQRDRAEAIEPSELELLFRVPECEALYGGEGHLSHLYVSALTGEGVNALLDWMTLMGVASNG